MCPPGYHYNGIMAARELGHTMYGYTLYIYVYTHMMIADDESRLSIYQIRSL